MVSPSSLGKSVLSPQCPNLPPEHQGLCHVGWRSSPQHPSSLGQGWGLLGVLPSASPSPALRQSRARTCRRQRPCRSPQAGVVLVRGSPWVCPPMKAGSGSTPGSCTKRCCCGWGWGFRSRFCRYSRLSDKLIQNPGSHSARNLDLEPKVTLGPYCCHG